jgi:selenocysteine-specific elongation factor
MRVIGTAGHVDHGKSTLVEALTGTHPDRLKEEREREMTIDLGFAWMTLPEGEEIGIVDVPGHRDFIENMLAGVGGIDAVIFVVAADEGVMPQTREHLAILDILQIQGGVVVLTKIDLVDDPEWLNLIEEDLRQVLAGTILADAPILRVSARNRQGLPELILAIQACLAGRPPRADIGRPRLPVDRVFTIAGFGTVVTGTLIDGHLKTGDEIQVLPQDLRGRVRGLQNHNRKEEIAYPGSRTAVNISGIDVDQFQRGAVVCHPGDYQTTRRLDLSFHLLQDVSQVLRHNTEVKLFIGSAEVIARLRLLGKEVLEPGDTGWIQLELADPVVAVRGDRYILRRPSPGETLGGGTVIDPNPPCRHKRFDEKNLARLAAIATGKPVDVLLQTLMIEGPTTVKQLIIRSHLDREADSALKELITNQQIIDMEGEGNLSVISEALVASQGWWHTALEVVLREVETFHKTFPLKRGMPREELKSRLKTALRMDLPPRLFTALLRKLVLEGYLMDDGPLVRLLVFFVRFNDQQQLAITGLMSRFAASPYTPPSVKECQAEVGENVFSALVDMGRLVQVAPDVVFRQEDYEGMKLDVRRMLETSGSITAAQVRDHFNTSRRYVLALLEHLDAIGLTSREGDFRRLKIQSP